jgi:acylphosphatase
VGAESEEARRAIVHGRVQGVGFRMAVSEAAARIGGLRGFVRNLPDGTVEVVMSGSPERVERLSEFLRRGPPAARVTSIEHEPFKGLLPENGFRIDF